MTSLVESTLRSQREQWKEISERVAGLSSREFPHEAPKRILLFGIGSSHFAARLIGFTLIRDKTRLRTPVVACASSSLGNEVIPQRGDWAFGISHRGGSGVTLQALEMCERAGAFTVQVSGQKAPEHASAHYVLPTVPIETIEPHTSALTGAICAVTSLIIGQKAVDEWDAVRSVGEPDLDLMRERAGQGPSVITGEWEGYWLAREGALKLMEMARLPVRAFSTEEYFHGPRHAMQPSDKIWHVELPKDPRNAEIPASHRIGVFGASPLSWVPALVELQWLALATALNLGVDPDLKS